MLQLCTAFIEQRIQSARDAIADAQASANEETKSSAGDKYETGRAMAQLEIEKNSTRLADAQGQRKILEGINPENQSGVVQSGSVIITSKGNFFIAVAAGKLTVDDEDYMAVSAAAPIARVFIGRTKGDVMAFNTSQYTIEKVF